MLNRRLFILISDTFKILLGLIRLLFKSNKRLLSNHVNVIKDESFSGSLIFLTFDFENLLYAEFPGVGKKFKNGEILLNSSNMTFPYVIKFQGLNRRVFVEIDFTPQNELKLNGIEGIKKRDFKYKRKKIKSQQSDLVFKKIALQQKKKIKFKTSAIKLTSNEIKIELNPFNKNSYL